MFILLGLSLQELAGYNSPDRNEGAYATDGGRNVQDAYFLNARRFTLTAGQTIPNDLFDQYSFISFPNVNAINLNNVIVNGTNSGAADYIIGSNVSLVSDNTYRLNAVGTVTNNIAVGDAVTYNFVENSNNYSRQGSVTQITGNNIDVDLGDFSFGRQDQVLVSGFTATHAHLNGTYTATTTIPTFTGFDPDGTENTPVTNSTVYRRIAGCTLHFLYLE